MYTNVSLTKLSRAFESWCSCAWFQAFSKANSLLSWIEESDGRDGAERENIVNRTQPAKVIFIALCLSRIANAESHNVCFDCQSQMQPWNLFPQWQVRAFLYGDRALAPCSGRLGAGIETVMRRRRTKSRRRQASPPEPCPQKRWNRAFRPFDCRFIHPIHPLRQNLWLRFPAVKAGSTSPSGMAFAVWHFAAEIKCCCNRKPDSRWEDIFQNLSPLFATCRTRALCYGEIVIFS